MFWISLLPQIISYLSVYVFISDSFTLIPCVIVQEYIGLLMIDKINSKIVKVNTNHSNSYDIIVNVKQYIEEHNEFCENILKNNIFWNKILFAFVLTLIPTNLLCFTSVPV